MVSASRNLSRVEFAAQRRTVLDEAERMLRATVRKALRDWPKAGWYDPIIERAGTVFDEAYRDEGGNRQYAADSHLGRIRSALRKSLDKTKKPRESTAETITRGVATALVNAATIAAAEEDPDPDVVLEWVTMHDDRVRESHRLADGQQRERGAPFHVGGVEMRHPGDTSAPPDEWIGCRCVLRPAKREDALVAAVVEAAKYDAEQLRKMLADGHAIANPNGEPSYPIGDKEDLAKAIQAVGRGSGDHDKIRAYIKRRAADLGASEMIPDTWSVETAAADTEAPPEAPPEEEQAAPSAVGQPVPWYGTLVVEGSRAGDKRRFAKGALRNRDLPLPLTWQKATAKGHDGSIIVGRIDAMSRIAKDGEEPNLVNAYGVFRQTPEADEALGLLIDFGRFGVSVDADDFAAEETDEGVDFTDARICSASMVAIPAFAEANIMLGEAPPGWMGEEVDDEATPEAIDGFEGGNFATEFGRGPGWVTNPKGTARLHDYWTKGEGAAKIAWGTGGDFNRCRTMVGEEVGESDPAKLRYINAQCAQWHKDALGYWPATHAKMLGKHSLQEEPAPALNLVASAKPEKWLPPTEWFTNPNLSQLTPTTVIEHPHGTEIFGHLCDWQGCHTGFDEVCTPPPRAQSLNPYGYFHGGILPTTDGVIPVGQLTMGGGHADVRLGWKAALAHYDDVSTVAADVRVGEDSFGIWFHGWLRPTLSDEQRVQFMTSRLSGDWRYINGHREFILAHCVNGAGFPVPRQQVAVHDGVQISLVAAGIVQEAPVVVDTTQIDVPAAIAAGIEQYESKRLIREAALSVNATPAALLEELRAEFATEENDGVRMR